ncbi:MAG: 4Fe-4S binding protein [Bacteroidales bacterium]
MKNKHLKKIRLIISLFFLITLGMFFLQLAGLFPTKFIRSITFIQFIPSALKFFNVFTWGAIGFIIVLILTLLFGRIYCSTVCPLGILQDVISYLKRKFRKKSKYKYLKAYNWLRYSILVISIAFLLGGSILIISLLDPYSIFGRITSDLFRPLVIMGNNSLAGILNNYGIYTLYNIDFPTVHIWLIMIPAVFFIAIVWMALTNGRIYCNTICPVGTFLGFLSKYSIFQIRLNSNSCTKCGLCEKACKAGCIETSTQHIDFSRCVGCFNCMEACPFSSAEYAFNKIYRKNSVPSASADNIETDVNKRKFLGGLILGFFGISKLARAQEVVSYSAMMPITRNNPISPPGAGSIKRFNEACTACHLCVNACPTNVLQPSVLEYGLRGLMQPRLDNHSGFCNYDCVICGEVCPTGAILPISVEDKRLTQMGQVRFVKENCIVETEGTDCGSCAEHCPTQAVTMVEYQNNLMIPEVDTEICVGCGACEHACPTMPYKAIYVEGNPVHVRAKEPKQEELEEVEHEEDFPF